MADSTESIVYSEAVRMISEQRGVRDDLVALLLALGGSIYGIIRLVERLL